MSDISFELENIGREYAETERRIAQDYAVRDAIVVLSRAEESPERREIARRNFLLCDLIVASIDAQAPIVTATLLNDETNSLMEAGAIACHATAPDAVMLSGDAWRRRYRELFSSIRMRDRAPEAADVLDIMFALHQSKGPYYYDLDRHVG